MDKIPNNSRGNVGEPKGLSFADGQASGIEELTGATPMSINMLVDAAGALFTRPGLSVWADWGCPALAATEIGAGAVIGSGLWPSPSGDRLVYVTADRRLWAMLGPNNRIVLSDATAATRLDGTLRPTFAFTKTRVVIAGGGVPQKWEGFGLSARLGGSPPVMSHVVANASRLVGSAPTVGGFEFWSKTGDTPGHETWDTGFDFAEAEARPDIIIATHENSNEVFAFGSETLQLFIPDGSSVYAPGRPSNFGCKAAYSVISLGDDGFALLADDQGPVFGQTDGRSLTSLSRPTMTKTLKRFGTLSDCWGFRVQIEGWDLAVWTFPTEGRTLVFDAGMKQWSEWRGYDGTQWTPWAGQSHVYWPAYELHLIGMADGTMMKLDPDAFQDGDDVLRGLVRTGYQNGDDRSVKTCERLALTMQRGNAEDAESEVLVSWRDDRGAFCEPLRFGLGQSGDTTTTVMEWALGQYRERQWQMEFSANSRLVLAAVEEIVNREDA